MVIIHDIKTPVDSDTLRYLAAVKGKALLDASPDKSKKQKPVEKPREITPKSSTTTKGSIQIVDVAARKGHGLIIQGVRQRRSDVYRDSVKKILELRGKRDQELAAKVKRFQEKLAAMSPEELEEVRRLFPPGASSGTPPAAST